MRLRFQFDVAITILRLIGYPASPACRFPSMKHYRLLVASHARTMCSDILRVRSGDIRYKALPWREMHLADGRQLFSLNKRTFTALPTLVP